MLTFCVVSGIIVMMFMTIYMMKLSSYAHVNYNLRQENNRGQNNGYPNHVNLKSESFIHLNLIMAFFQCFS